MFHNNPTTPLNLSCHALPLQLFFKKAFKNTILDYNQMFGGYNFLQKSQAWIPNLK